MDQASKDEPTLSQGLSAQQSKWIRDVISLMAAVILAAGILISVGVVFGIYTLRETAPVYILLVSILPLRWVAHHKNFRWIAYFPALLLLGLGIYGSTVGGFYSLAVLFYLLAVMLSVLMPDTRASLVIATIGILTHIIIGGMVEGFPEGNTGRYILYAFTMLGVALLQWYTITNYWQSLKALTSANLSLQSEAEQRQITETKFGHIVESLPLGIHMYHLDEKDRLIFSGYNPAANRILGIDHAEKMGLAIEAAFPGLQQGEVPDRYRRLARDGGEWEKDEIIYSDEGIAGAYEVHAFQSSPGMMVSIFSDITTRLRAEEAIRLSEEKFSTAFQISPDSININRMADGIYLDINQGFTQLMGYSREEVIGKSSLELNVWESPADRARLVKGLQECGVVENLEARFRRKNGEVGFGLMSARVISIQGEQCILSITRDITDRIQSELDLREAHTRLEQAYEATLLGWAHALELRERETGNHSQRVVEQTLVLARELGIHGQDLVNIKRGALLHDIGKMGVPDNILLKPGPLTDDEWVTMRQHVEFAQIMLRGIEYLHPSIDIPYCHHEKWDGSGYPRGLKGEAIPLAARIFAVVDVFDALSHDRPYRPAWNKEDACRYMRQMSGKHFDPLIVDLFISKISQCCTG